MKAGLRGLAMFDYNTNTLRRGTQPGIHRYPTGDNACGICGTYPTNMFVNLGRLKVQERLCCFFKRVLGYNFLFLVFFCFMGFSFAGE